MQPASPSQIGAHAAKLAACWFERSPPAASVLHVAVYPSNTLPLPTAAQLPLAVAVGAADVDVAVPVEVAGNGMDAELEDEAEEEAGMDAELEDEDEEEAGLMPTSTFASVEVAVRELLK